VSKTESIEFKLELDANDAKKKKEKEETKNFKKYNI
jgi:hypothetical protein